MRIQTAPKTPEFTPIELNIIFDTEEELESFAAMCGRDVTVSDMITTQSECRNYPLVTRQALRTILAKCYSHLKPYMKNP